MARKADTPCRSCGQLLFVGKGSLLEPTCRPCRQASPKRAPRQSPLIRPCLSCGQDFAVRNSVHVMCTSCAAWRKDNRLKTCAWCGEQRWFDRKATCCSKQCATDMRWPPSTKLVWQHCVSCLSWFAHPDAGRFGTCSAACETAAVTILCKAKAEWRSVECDKCGDNFETNQPVQRFCSRRCSRKDSHLRRKVRECGSYGQWTWSDFMRVARKFGYCCAYCGTKPDRLDPDHVIPLAKQGPNTISNLLPACAACNSDKSALTLDEWDESRHRRGLLPVTTTWDRTDSRYWHLTAVLRWNPVAA